nr:ubiquitin carboxyl terminal hydrolase 16 [Hymenolepis microstoma]
MPVYRYFIHCLLFTSFCKSWLILVSSIDVLMGRKKARNRVFEKANERGDRKEDKKVPKGLINVGNTCYFNSTLQCISRVNALHKWIEYLSCGGRLAYLKKSHNDGNTQTLRLTLPKVELQFSRTFVNFVENLFGPGNNRTSITPECLRKQLVSNYRQLDNNAQHDSHEALRCILDRLRSEEKRLWQRAILDEKKCTISASEELKEDIKSWGQCTGLSTTVDRIFGGVLLSSIQCTICKNTSIRFETFLDISLPISIGTSEPDPYFQKPNFDKRKKNKKGKKCRNRRNSDNSQFDVNENQNHHSRLTVNSDNKENAKKSKGNAKRSAKKNKYGRKWRLENSDHDDEENDQRNKSVQDLEENESIHGSEEYEEGGQNGFDLDAEEENDDSCSNDDNASLEPNHGSVSDFRDIMVDDLDSGSNRSTGSPESVMEFVEEEGEGQDDQGFQKSNGKQPDSPLSSVEGEKKSLASTSTGDAADMEDNADDADDLSTISLPKTAFDDELFCQEFILKSRLAEAGNKTAIAQPEEEKRAKELSICSILEQQKKDDLLTDLERCLTKYFESEELKGDNRITCAVCTKKAQSSTVDVDNCRSTTGGDGSVRCDSLKRDLLLKLPAILTIQLKRYQKNGYQLRKFNNFISFPINLDIRPYCSRLAWLGAEEGQYRLFGIVEHSGSLSSGHYVAYVAENTDGDIPGDCFIPTLDKPFPWPLNLHHLVYQLRRGDQSVLNGDPTASNHTHQEDSRTWHYFSDTSVHKVALSEVLNAKPYLLFYQRVR